MNRSTLILATISIGIWMSLAIVASSSKCPKREKELDNGFLKENCGYMTSAAFNPNGKQDASDGQFPFVVSIEYRNNHACMGSLISPRVVLTSATCADQLPTKKQSKHVFGIVGLNDKKSCEQKLTIADKVIHQDYDNKTKENDIALLILQSEADLAYYNTGLGNAGLVCLPDRLKLPKYLRLAGWFDKDEKLQYTNFKLVDTSNCDIQAGANMICMQSNSKQSLMEVNLGAGLFGVNDDKFKLAAILIDDFNENSYGVALEISSYKQWINDIIYQSGVYQPSAFAEQYDVEQFEDL